MRTTININGKSVEITLTDEQVKAIKQGNLNSPMDVIYAYHNTTEKEFEKAYKGVSLFSKYQEIEGMIVDYYNKGEKVDFNNSNQTKYMPYFDMRDDTFSCNYCNYWNSRSNSSARLCFLRRDDMLEAVEVYLEQYRNSRNGKN